MHEHAAAFAARARERHGVDPDVAEFPDGTETAAEAAEAVGCPVGAIASSLAFRLSDDRLVVAVTSGANRVDEAALAAHFGVESASMADPGAVRETLGWAVGGVPPFCHDESVPVVLDPALEEYETVWAAAGAPTAVFPIAPADLRRYAEADLAAFT